MYGFYVSRTDYWWCADIQGLYEAGLCDDVILGNHSAIERALHQQCGEVKALVEWFEHMRWSGMESVKYRSRPPTVACRATEV